MNRQRIAVQQAHFVEEGQEFPSDPDLQVVFSCHPHPRQHRGLPRGVGLPSVDVFRLQARSAQLVNQRAGAQQPAEGVILRGDGRSVGIHHVVVQRQVVDVVPGFVLRHHASVRHHGRIQPESAVRRVPFHQVVPHNQLAYVHVAAAVSPVVQGERAVHRHDRSYHQLVVVVADRGLCRVPCGLFRRGRGKQHRQRHQNREYFLHCDPSCPVFFPSMGHGDKTAKAPSAREYPVRRESHAWISRRFRRCSCWCSGYPVPCRSHQ